MSSSAFSNGLLGILLAASLAGNVVLFLNRDEKESTPPPPSPPPNSHAREIAGYLGMRPASTKTEGDIATDIKLALDDVIKAPDDILSDQSIERLCMAATTAEESALIGTQEFLKKVQGKRILPLPDEQ